MRRGAGPTGGYFIWLELGDGSRRLRARSPRRRERRRHRAGPGLLPARFRSAEARPRALRSATRRPSESPRASNVSRRCSSAYERSSLRRARERSKRKPPSEADRDAEDDERKQASGRREEEEVHPDLLAVLERDDDGVEREHAQDDQRPRSVALRRLGARVGPFHEENPTRRDRRRRAEADAERAGAASVARERRLAPRGRSGTADSREERIGPRVGSNSRRRWRVSVSSSFSEGRPSTTSPHSVEQTRFGQAPSGQIPRNLRLFSEQ